VHPEQYENIKDKSFIWGNVLCAFNPLRMMATSVTKGGETEISQKTSRNPLLNVAGALT
jgi:hypothetical protein